MSKDSGFVESLEVGRDFIFLQGWTIQRGPQLGRLTIRVEGSLVGQADIIDVWDREDLADEVLKRRAFRCLVRVHDASISQKFIVSHSVGADTDYLPLLNPPREFVGKGFIEFIPGWGLAGWIWHPNNVSATLRLDESADISIPLNRSRADLPVAYHSAKQNGFELSLAQLTLLARSSDISASMCDGVERVARLFVGKDEVSRVAFSHHERFIGKVERYENNVLSGWACAKDPGSDVTLVDVYIGGTRYVTCEASHHRADLIRKGLVKEGGGFRIALPASLPGPSELRQVTARFHRSGAAVPGSKFEIPLRVENEFKVNFWEVLPASAPSISIIVPIYNAAESLERCLNSLVEHTNGRVRLILIDDASPQQAVQLVLAKYLQFENIHIFKNEKNLGFTRTINRGIEIAEKDDVVFLNSDTEVTPCWLEHLITAAYQSVEVGTVTPLSDNAGAFSVPEPNVKNHSLSSLGQESAARLITQASNISYPRVPTGNGFCLYVKRACIDAIGPLDAEDFPIGYGEENDFCQRAQRFGFYNIIDDRSLIFHERSASFLDQKGAHYAAGRQKIEEKYPEYGKQIRVFQDGKAIQEMRWSVRHAMQLDQGKKKKRVLYVIATETGGTPQTNRDLMNALDHEIEPFLLRCDSRQIFISKFAPDGDILLKRVGLVDEIQMSSHRSPEYNRIVADIIVRLGIELVHIRHIAWHSLDLTAICRMLSIPCIFSFHDFYTVCPNTKLLDENNLHCAGSCTPSFGKCEAELWPKASVPALKHRFVHHWRELLTASLELCDAFVTTSPEAKRILVSSFPKIDLQNLLQVIPHGRTFESMYMLSAPVASAEPLRILVPGNISDAKGASLIRATADLDQGKTVEFHVLGDGGKLQNGPGIHLHGRYSRQEIADKISAIKPHIGAVLSIWPETYCHTLSEMWSCGLPVLGMSIGAVGERIEETGAGWLIGPQASPNELLSVITSITSNPEDLLSRINSVSEWQRGTGTHYTIRDMGNRYSKLYDSVFQNRKSFTIAALKTGRSSASRSVA